MDWDDRIIPTRYLSISVFRQRVLFLLDSRISFPCKLALRGLIDQKRKATLFTSSINLTSDFLWQRSFEIKEFKTTPK